MPDELKRYRIFLGSPGGLETERAAFRAVLEEFNRNEASRRGALFVPVGWETTRGGTGRPQEHINQDLVTSDYFILLLWDRWGSPSSPPPSPYSSGSHEEFNLALGCFNDPKFPMRDMLILFKAVAPGRLKEPDPQLAKVLDFKRGLETTKDHHYRVIDSIPGFEQELQRHLDGWLKDHVHGRTGKVRRVATRPTPSTVPRRMTFPEHPSISPLVPEALSLASEGKRTDAELKFAKAIAQEDPAAFLIYARFLIEEGRLVQAGELLERAMAFSGTPTGKTVEAEALNISGELERFRGRPEAARGLHVRALGLYRDMGHELGVARTACLIGNLQRLEGDTEGAENSYGMAGTIYEKLSDPGGMAEVYGLLGLTQNQRGRYQAAAQLFNKSMQIEGGIGNDEGVARASENLGGALQQMGDLDGAENAYTRAKELFQALGRELNVATLLLSLGSIRRERRDPAGAEALYRRALSLLEKAQRPESLAVAYLNLGRLKQEAGEVDAAEPLLLEALRLNEEVGRLKGIAHTRERLGMLANGRGDLKKALEHWSVAEAAFRRMGNASRAAKIANWIREIRGRLGGS